MVFPQVVSPEAFQIHDLRVIHIEVHLEEERISKDFRTSMQDPKFHNEEKGEIMSIIPWDHTVL